MKWEKKETRYESGYYDPTYHMEIYSTQCFKYSISRDRSRPENRYGEVGQWGKFSRWAVYDETERKKLKEFDTVQEAKRYVKEYNALPPLPISA